jgi:hypothetical protein
MASLHAHTKTKKKVDAKKQPVLLDLDNEDSEVANADAKWGSRERETVI